jgi:hypothetical protein
VTEGNEVRGRIILGSGRSGTTWVQDCLAAANGLRPIFEPLHEGESELGWRFAYRMVTPGDSCEELERFFLDLSAGRIRSLWIDYRGRRQLLFPSPSKLATVRGLRGWIWLWRKHLADRRELRVATRQRETLIKCIRANLMAGWLSRKLGFRTVLLVRHPCASVESQYRRASAWNPEPVMDRYRSDKRLHDETDGAYLPLLNSGLTRLQALTLNWVIENQVPVARAANDGCTVIYYEHLREQPSVTWPSLCKALGLASVPGEELVQAPSQQSYEKNAKNGLLASKPRWQTALAADQLSEIQAVLDATECQLYSVSRSTPLMSVDRYASQDLVCR